MKDVDVILDILDILQYKISIKVNIFIPEERMDDPVPERIDGQFWNPEKILSGQMTLLQFVQRGETTPKTLDLVRSD